MTVKSKNKRDSNSISERISFIFCCSDGYRVSVDTFRTSLLRSSSFSSHMWYNLQSLSSGVFLVSPLYMSKSPQYCFPVPLCVILYHQSLPGVVVSNMVSYCVAACSSVHLHFCHFQFFTWDLITGTVSIRCSIAD